MGDSQPQVFSVRIVSIDHYTVPPIPGLDISYSSFHGGRVKEVPVIRIYGSTPAGQKVCLHVHQVLPYLYIPCSDLGAIASDEADSKTHSLSLALEKALQHRGNAGSKRQHVHGCDLVRAKKFYGYHPLEELFVKIYFYHPQDVSRAANLLLTGAVLDRVLQPYESHIPYLLQFLIDYNLYGMSHLHASKVKFRYPVPDVLSHWKTNQNHGKRPMKNDSKCMDFQADLGGDLCSNTPIWISSTIPDEWIWQYSSQSDSSMNDDTPLYKRQSTSELEADVAVHGIVNQLSLSFTPLSQANSDIKMVQSLLPIWEEEFVRNGVPEAIPFDSQKPSPLDALRFLADGVEFRDFMQVQNVADGSLLTTEPTKSSADSGDPTDSGIANLENSNHLPSKYLKAGDQRGSLLSLDSPFQSVDAAETKEVDVSDEVQVSGTMMDPTSAKDGDEDALRLLNWLASSQAAEDINSDDELARETILSPFLPSKEISRVLERATVDYESESQKECQDILDSVDMLNFEEANHRTSNSRESNHTNKFSLDKIIPQVDGSTDDPQASPSCSGKPHNTDASKAEQSVEDKLSPELHSDLSCNTRRKRPRWGSLPVSCEKVSNLPYPHESIRWDNKKNEWSEAFGDEAKRLSLLKVHEKNDENFIEQHSPVFECSTRDLMRRKRSRRNEHPQSKSQEEGWQAESCVNIEHVEKETNLDSKLLKDVEDNKSLLSHTETKCHETDKDSSSEVCNETSHVKPTSVPIAENLPLSSSNNIIEAGNLHKNMNSNCAAGVDCGKHAHSHVDMICSSYAEDTPVSVSVGADFGHKVLRIGDIGKMPSNSTLSTPPSKFFCTGERICQTSISMSKLPDTPADCTDSIERRATMQFEHPTSRGRNPDLAMPCSISNVNEESESAERIGVTTFEKPPAIDGMDDPENDTPLLHCNGESIVGTSLHGRPAIDSPPVFKMNCLEEKLNGVSPEKCYHIGNQEPAMGVPIIYQNDGSCLYMLTPPVLPPSRESVEKWLSIDCSNVSPKIGEPSAFLPVLKGFSGDMIGSQSSQSEDSNCALPEPTSLPDVMPTSDHQINCNQESCSVKARAFDGTRINISPGHSQDVSQISGPDKKIRLTPLSQTGFRDPASVGQGQQLTLLSIEVQAESRGELRPDPRFDAVNIIVLVFQEDDESKFDTHVLLRCHPPHVEKNLDAATESKVSMFTEELHMFNQFTKVVRASDPDVLMGWDVQSGSLGFLAERAAHLGIGLLNNISRTPSQVNLVSKNPGATENDLVKEIFSESVAVDAACLENTIIEDEWGRTHASGVHVGGRIVLNVWRLMRNEVKLNIYTVEAVAETVLRRKIPHIPWKVLAKWFSSGPGRARYRSLDYTVERAKLNLQIMNQLDMINRTSELARVFGIDFFSVLSRGSQYRVESMFLRLAHTQNYLAISPGNQQVACQPAMECLPLVMEPESRFYADPVIVLDFQSLYPSMVIAYNLCFCTCLGKIIPPKPNTLGVSSYSLDTNILQKLKHELLFTPNGVVYVPSNVRKGILPRLLEEILSTRIMVKQAMKKLSPSQIRHRILNARQLALKLIANVTYGYTAAGFSGRMPCAELADSIVQCGRRTLETAISFVNSNDKWKARVIYGDTDSMFVLLKGRSLQEAFTVGREIATAITEMNPTPVVLKMEKVYYPCFLLTKKRYVGYSYESPEQSKPTFDAKGIETVRRDTCGAVSKIMEQSLRFYFESQDIDKVKTYITRQWTRILSGRVSLQDFIFAKEVRLGTYSERFSSLPPAAIVATKAMRADPRAEPRYAERVPYVVVHGEPGARLVDMVVNPLELLALDSPFRLNDIYYIRKQIIPALQRVFGLVGANLNQWFLDMPRPAREAVGKRHSLVPNPQRTRIDSYYASKHCILCGDLVQGLTHLCPNCSMNETTAAAALTGRTSKLEKDIQHLVAICRHCGGGDWVIESGVKCNSLACSIFYERIKVQKELQSFSEVATKSGFYPKCMVEWF